MLVLIADDNADNRALIKDILTPQGYEFVSARDGLETLSLARDLLPDLLILDINMPGIDGFEVCARLRSDPNTAQIPVLMLTALTDVESRVRGLGLGADDYLTKPFNPRELLARVDIRLRAKATTDELRATQQQIRRTFERFVSAQVVEQLLANPSQVQLGGHLQEVTVLFADLEGFTSISETAPPEHLLSVLNQYHSLLVEHIQRERGTVDKFLGDGIMALYNTPLAQADHALRAVRTAVNIHRALPTFHEQFASNYRWNVNFGIHTGEAVVGNVGTPELMDFTAVGDTVNLASRLEGLSQSNQIIISQAVYDRVAPHITGQALGPRKVKGREEPVGVYEVLELNS